MRASKYQFEEWPTDLLIDYALKIHHRGIREKGPEILSLIHSMMGENQLMAEIESLFTNNYTPAADASGDYKLLLSLLKNFAEDLNEHVYIENEIIFPRSQLLEQQLLS